MIKLVTVAHIIALARNRVPILINIASRKPIFQEEFLGFEGFRLTDGNIPAYIDQHWLVRRAGQRR